MPHFLNSFTTTSFLTPFQDLRIQSQTWATDAFLILPVGIKALSADCSHHFHSSSLGPWRASRGCSSLVSPPGITESWVFKSAEIAFALCVTRLWSDQKQVIKAGFLSNSPGLHDQTLLNQIFTPSVFIHPFSCTCTITPLGIFSFGNIILLKMIIVGSFVPSARQAWTTVKCFFSWPLVLTAIVFAPLMSTVLLDAHQMWVGPHPWWRSGTAQSCESFEDWSHKNEIPKPDSHRLLEVWGQVSFMPSGANLLSL